MAFSDDVHKIRSSVEGAHRAASQRQEYEAASQLGVRCPPQPGPISALKTLGESIDSLTHRVQMLAANLCGEEPEPECEGSRLSHGGLLGAVQHGAEESTDRVLRAQRAMDRIERSLT